VADLKQKSWSLREVMCATTLKPSSAELVAYAHKLAALHGAELVIVHVRNNGNEKETDWVSFEEAFHYYAEEGIGKGTWLRDRLASTPPGVTIVDLARQRGSDLIVLGARPASSIATHFPPGTAAKVLLDAPCPVLTLLQS
jgi:nucleotide-binding universal stress UspA family protein